MRAPNAISYLEGTSNDFCDNTGYSREENLYINEKDGEITHQTLVRWLSNMTKKLQNSPHSSNWNTELVATIDEMASSNKQQRVFNMARPELYCCDKAELLLNESFQPDTDDAPPTVVVDTKRRNTPVAIVKHNGEGSLYVLEKNLHFNLFPTAFYDAGYIDPSARVVALDDIKQELRSRSLASENRRHISPLLLRPSVFAIPSWVRRELGGTIVETHQDIKDRTHNLLGSYAVSSTRRWFF